MTQCCGALPWNSTNKLVLGHAMLQVCELNKSTTSLNLSKPRINAENKLLVVVVLY